MAAARLADRPSATVRDADAKVQALLEAAPELNPDLARHLALDGDREWIQHCRDVGPSPLVEACRMFETILIQASREEFMRKRDLLDRAFLRLAEGLEVLCDWRAPGDSRRLCLAFSLEEDYRFHQAKAYRIHPGGNHLLKPEERLAGYQRLLAEAPPKYGLGYVLAIHHMIAGAELECGRRDRHLAGLRTVLELARQANDPFMECQLLGDLGAAYIENDQPDSTRRCYEEGLRIAARHSFHDQYARLAIFNARTYTEQGKLASAVERLNEARLLFDAAGGGMDRLRIQIEYLRFLARLECWDLVDRGLRRIPPLLRSCPGSDALTAHTLNADRLRAVLAFVQERPDDGDRILRRWVNAVPNGERRIGYAAIYDEWSNGLFRCGRYADALEKCARGIQHCDTALVPERRLPLLVRRAALLDAMDRPAEARAALDLAFEQMKTYTPSERRRRQAELLAARIEHHEGNVAEARRRVRAIFRSFQERLASRESGTQGYLQLDEATAVRDHVHEIEGFSPAAGYAFEMEWRSMGAAMTGQRRPIPGTGAVLTSSGEPPPAHVVYRFTRKHLIRWTRTASGVALDTLPVLQRECLDDVREAIALLQSEPAPSGAELGPRAFAKLRELAKQLLPAGLAQGSAAPVPLRVSADGPLLALPFEALVARGPNGEAPLASWSDVEYVHGWGVNAPSASGPPVIVSSPTLSADLERRYPWARSGTAGEAETRAALERWPGAIHLEGPRATRDTVLNRWRQAPLIYLAAHHVRDPDAPFLGFVPMAAATGAPLDDALLEMADVHGLDLSGCRLVVLASCASGAPYHLTARPGPSLADAFLDSGARSVVRSLWDVGEDETRALMSRFLATWRPEDRDAAALGRARRAFMATPAGASPRAWAAWGVQTTLPAERAGMGSVLAAVMPASRPSR